ncbi:hypothetical protein Bca101_083884 [Brassica carinata]
MEICIRAKNNAWAIAPLIALYGFRESNVTLFLMLQALSKVSATGTSTEHSPWTKTLQSFKIFLDDFY